MNPDHSKSQFLYGQIRCGLRTGRYVPGQRIDPATLAREFKTSPTPVRFALYRLVGEGMLADHSRGGLQVPLMTELALREYYDWIQLLLLMACERIKHPAPTVGKQLSSSDPHEDEDAAKLAWKLFDAIAGAAAYRPLQETLGRVNDRLAPVRQAECSLLPNVHDEIGSLFELWHLRDMAALKAALIHYYARRMDLVPRIVALLHERRDEIN